jgi:hypothetical protein
MAALFLPWLASELRSMLSRRQDLSYYGYMHYRDEVRYEIKFRQCRIVVASPSPGQ